MRTIKITIRILIGLLYLVTASLPNHLYYTEHLGGYDLRLAHQVLR